MKTIAVVLCVLFSFSVASYAQNAKRTVTNEDLERFSQQRIAADREYRRTYAEKGLPSPDEIKAHSEARVKDTVELAEKLEAANLEREKLAIAAMQLQSQAPQTVVISPNGSGYYPSDYGYWGYGSGYGVFDNFGRRSFGRGRLGNVRGGYAAGGMVWPAPIVTGGTRAPRPAIARPVVNPRPR